MYTTYKLDKARNVRFGMKALSLIEDNLGSKIGKIDFENLGIKDTCTVLWAGMVHEDNELTVDRLMELIDEHSSFQEMADVLAKAMIASFPDPQPKRKNAKRA